MYVLATMDIKNAFNTPSWNKILLEAEERGMLRKLLTFLGKYPGDRKIIVHNIGGWVKRNVFAGASQGSIIGLLLWNMVYDGLLRKLQDIPYLNAALFADDLSLIFDMAKQEEITERLGRTMNTATRRCLVNGLNIVQEETEVILITGKRIPKIMEINMGGYFLRTKLEVGYLGVQLDNRRRFCAHFENVCGNADELMGVYIL